jgi:hypothetical protein
MVDVLQQFFTLILRFFNNLYIYCVLFIHTYIYFTDIDHEELLKVIICPKFLLQETATPLVLVKYGRNLTLAYSLYYLYCVAV